MPDFSRGKLISISVNGITVNNPVIAGPPEIIPDYLHQFFQILCPVCPAILFSTSRGITSPLQNDFLQFFESFHIFIHVVIVPCRLSLPDVCLSPSSPSLPGRLESKKLNKKNITYHSELCGGGRSRTFLSLVFPLSSATMAGLSNEIFQHHVSN